MGQTLSEPVTSKETASCANSFVKVGSSCMQGWRINMEDAHTHLLSVPEDKDACFFAVYDGHGGAKVAQYAGNHLHKRVVQSAAYASGNIEEAIRTGFLGLDEDMTKDEEMREEMAGTTAVTVLIKSGKIYCGNVGDSRAVASVNGLAEPLSYDHKPANEEEAKRIIAAGGWVEFNRVNGNLALSRALGDFVFKRNEDKPAEEQIVTAFPDVIVRDLTSNDEFIILACDGIWDVLSNQEAIDFCRDRIAARMEPEQICEELLTRCLAPDCQMGGLGCDNMTTVLVCLLQNESWDDLCRKCSIPRPPTPFLEDESEGSPSSFETPPVTPVHRVFSGNNGIRSEGELIKSTEPEDENVSASGQAACNISKREDLPTQQAEQNACAAQNNAGVAVSSSAASNGLSSSVTAESGVERNDRAASREDDEEELETPPSQFDVELPPTANNNTEKCSAEVCADSILLSSKGSQPQQSAPVLETSSASNNVVVTSVRS